MNDAQVLIAGGGPVGLICAYALGKRGIDVAVFDENPELQDDPRAATTHPATLELLAALGVIDEVIEQGLVAKNSNFGTDRPANALRFSTTRRWQTTPTFRSWSSASSSSLQKSSSPGYRVWTTCRFISTTAPRT